MLTSGPHFRGVRETWTQVVSPLCLKTHSSSHPFPALIFAVSWGPAPKELCSSGLLHSYLGGLKPETIPYSAIVFQPSNVGRQQSPTQKDGLHDSLSYSSPSFCGASRSAVYLRLHLKLVRQNPHPVKSSQNSKSLQRGLRTFIRRCNFLFSPLSISLYIYCISHSVYKYIFKHLIFYIHVVSVQINRTYQIVSNIFVHLISLSSGICVGKGSRDEVFVSLIVSFRFLFTIKELEYCSVC